MKNFIVFFSALFLLSVLPNPLVAQCSQKIKLVKTSHHAGDKDVVDIAVSSNVHTTLVAAVKAAGLVETLKGDGPFTIFAPTNAAFNALPDGTVASLLEPENKSQLTSILTYHVVAGHFDAKAVIDAIHKGNGKATIPTIQGGTLTATLKDGNVYLIDENLNLAKVTTTDLKGTNGVIHVIDTVVIPD